MVNHLINSPATGDTSNMLPWILIGTLALLICVVLILTGTKKRKKK